MKNSLTETSFAEAFEKTQAVLGLQHYHVNCVETQVAEIPGLCADIAVEVEQCVALVRFNASQCASDGGVVAAAVHEAVHLLIADLKFALLYRPQTADMEEERVARRLEPLLLRLLFGAE